MDIKLLASILITGHIISAIFTSIVINRQRNLFRIKVDPDIQKVRRVLFGMSITVFIGNLIPILVDAGTLVGSITRSSHHVNAVGILYSVSNVVTAVVSAILIWTLYRLAARTLIDVENERIEPSR